MHFYTALLISPYSGVQKDPKSWKAVYDSLAPQDATFPKPFEKCAGMVRLVIIRCLRSDKVVPAVQVSRIESLRCVYLK